MGKDDSVSAQGKVVRFKHACSILTIALLGATVLVWDAGPVAAAAPCPIPGNFEIDGDMLQATCTPAGDDWNTPGIGVQSTTQGGTYQTSGKDDANPSTWQSSGSTPDKTNFERAYATSRVVGGHFYVFVAWERTSTSGTQGYAIEIDNSGANVGADGTPQPNRGSGGAVFYISSQGSSPPTFDSACSFTSQSNYGTTCTSSNSSVTSAINTTTISDPLAGTSQAAGSFFEVALDVTALTGIVPSCPGASAASVYLRSITGQTHNGNLKGYMAPLSVAPNSTCTPPPIVTTATPGGLLNAPGSTQHDTVTVGLPQAPGVGSVKFYLCPPAVVTANGGDCSANGALVSTNTLDSMGEATSGNVTGATTPADNATGKYCWRTEFTPSADDHNYLQATHTNGLSNGAAGSECFTIVHGTPSISTQIQVTGDNAPGLGFTSLGDTAQLSGFVGSVTGEVVTFDLYGPFADGVTPVCDEASRIAGAATSGVLNASGQATTASTYSPTAPGTYVWIATYPGDALNDGVSGTCSDADESATIIGATVDVSKSSNPPGPVDAGEMIGFDITVTNTGSVPSQNTIVTDNLPGTANGNVSGTLNWSLSPTYTGCSISGAAGSQVLTCNLGTVAADATLPPIHVVSTTAPVDCGVVANAASVTSGNGTGGDSDTATVTVECADLVLSKTADDAAVDAGSPIGFTITASNAGPGTAAGVVVNDPLPGGAGIDWSITSGPANCSITGSPQTETLVCTAATLLPGDSEVVHVSSDTTEESCAVYDNTATLTATNAPSPEPATASTVVRCAQLFVLKTADADQVRAGAQIGFVVTVTNDGPGAVHDAALTDPLPRGAGISWSIEEADTTASSCSITGGAGGQTLGCALGDLPADTSVSVHVISGTNDQSCRVYRNVATVDGSNVGEISAQADTEVTRCLGFQPEPPTSTPPSSPPLPATSGTGAPVRDELRLVLLLLGVGTVLALIGRRRNGARDH